MPRIVVPLVEVAVLQSILLQLLASSCSRESVHICTACRNVSAVLSGVVVLMERQLRTVWIWITRSEEIAERYGFHHGASVICCLRYLNSRICEATESFSCLMCIVMRMPC